MKIETRNAVSTTIVAIIIAILVIAAIAGIYLASSSHSTTTTTVTSTSTASGTTSTVTTTTTTSGSASSSSAIPANTIIEGIVGPEWGSNNIGGDVQCGWDTESMWYANNYEQLYQYDPYQLSQGNYVPIPWLATNSTLSANGTSLTINLQQGVKFHSGDTMTSADVVYSFDRFQFATNRSSTFEDCPGTGLATSDVFSSMKSIRATGTYQVVLTLNYPDPNIFQELANQGFSILDSKVLQQHTVVNGTGPNATSDWGFTWLDAGPQDVGTGPFQMTSFTYEQRAELQAFSGYWGGPFGNYTSNVKTEIFIPYADATTAQFALQEGQINVVQDETDSAISSLSTTAGISVNTSPAYLFFYLWMHPVGPLSNWEVRDAVKDALNYSSITQGLTNGYGKTDSSFFPIGTQGYNATYADQFAAAGPNITGAKALLKEAGYPNGFSVNLYTRPSSRYGVTFVDLAEILQSDLAAVNITLTIQVYVVGQFYDLAENSSLPGIWTVPGSLDALIPVDWALDYAALGNQNATYFQWSAKTETGPGVPFAQMDTLLNETKQATTAAAAVQYLTELDQLYQKYGPSVAIMQLSNAVAYSSSVKGVVWNGVSDCFMPYYLET